MKMPVFVINLERDRDSWETVAASVREHEENVELHRIDAVDGRAIDVNDYEDVDIDLFRRRNGREILAGEYGCYRSHLKALEAFIAHGAPYGLILEDDVLFNRNTGARMRAIIEAVPDFGVMKLVNHRRRYMIDLGETPSGDHVGRTMHGPQGSAAAYLVSREGARHLIGTLSTMSLPWDVALERFWTNDADVFSIKEDVLDFSTHRARSTIGADGGYNKVKYSRHRRLGAAGFRFKEIFARAWNVMLQPSQIHDARANGGTLLKPAAAFDPPFWVSVLTGLVAITFVSATWIETDAYRYAGLALILAALVHYFRADFWTYGKPLIGWAGFLCMGWAAYVAIRFAYVKLVHPDHGTGSAEGIYLLAFLYPTFGYALYLFVRRPFPLAIVFLAISLVVLVFGIDYTPARDVRALTLLQNNPIHASVASGFIALCALPLALYALRRDGLTAIGRTLVVSLALATFIVALFSIYAFLSKGVWLAIAVALPVLAISVILTEKGRLARGVTAAALFLVVIGVAVAHEMVLRTIGESVHVSLEMASELTSGGGIVASIDKAIADPATPVSQRERLMLWSSALQLWAERPIFGAGISWLHYWQDRPYQEVNFNLLHNGYMELAVRYGVVGLAFYAFLIGWSFVRIRQAARAGLVDVCVLQCYCATVAFFAVTLLTNSNIRLAIGESYVWMSASVGFYCYYLLQRRGDVRPGTIF